MWSRLVRRINKQAGKFKRSIVKRGRVAALLASVPDDAVILEIGGGYDPRFTKPHHRNVHHLDHDTTEGLRAKYAADPAVADRIGRIQPIDFVFNGRPIDELIPPTLRFDLIYGSHVLEHQVDLIGHLQSLEKLLKPEGRVIEMIPDLRATFDALRYPTVTADALVAHLQPGPIHQGKQVFDALSREIDKNHGYRMCEADFEGAAFSHRLKHAFDAMRAAERPGQPYADMHAWTFTPESFRLLMIELRLLGLTRLASTFVSPLYGNQFCVVLRTEQDPAEHLQPTTRDALESQRLALCRALRLR
jgi:predicted SAM-dependent methyltransferase